LSTTTLIESRTTTATENVNINVPDRGTGGPFFPNHTWKAGRFILNVTNAATDSSDTFDVYLQSGVRSPNATSAETIIWDDFVHFTQVAGNATEPIQHIAIWQRDGQTPESEMHIPKTDDISAGVVQGPTGPYLRVRVVVVDSGDANQTFTWEVMANIVEEI